MRRELIVTFFALLSTLNLVGCTKGPQKGFSQQSETSSNRSESSGIALGADVEQSALPQTAPNHRSKSAIAYPSVKGVYLTHPGLMGRQFTLVRRLLKQGELNAVVVDIKDGSGRVFLDVSTKHRIQVLKQDGVYVIGRMVAFKDSKAARIHPDWSIKRPDGRPLIFQGSQWLDPTNSFVRRYNIHLAKEALTLGVDEIQWDYVRFPDVKLANARFSVRNFKRGDAIAGFLREGTAAIHAQGAKVSADVFGLVTTATDDMGIGQIWEKISSSIDVISPMMYPSHYAAGSYGTTRPELYPTIIISRGLKDAIQRNRQMHNKGKPIAVIRPWYQDFDMRTRYGKREVRAQISAGKSLGVKSYLLWNPAGIYTKGV